MSEIVEHPEYNNSDNPYPSFGKRYCGERGVISLTSWKMRIHTVAKTLYSLYTMCPGFHIVLVLSEEEFPLMEKELPENLMLFVENELIEILWIYPNWKSFKKVLPTMDKYRDVPVISADDDCIYTCNYAQELYDKWTSFNKQKYVIGMCKIGNNGFVNVPNGFASLYSPNTLNINDLIKIINILLSKNISADDSLYGFYIDKNNIPLVHIKHKIKDVGYFHDDNNPISNFSTIIGKSAAIIINDIINHKVL